MKTNSRKTGRAGKGEKPGKFKSPRMFLAPCRLITIFLIYLAILMSPAVLAQNKFSFYKGSNLLISTIDGEVSLLGSDIKIKNEKIINTSKYYTYSVMPEDVLSNIQFSEDMGFYSALQSMTDENSWIFVEIMKDKGYYNVSFYDHESKTKNIIFTQEKSPDKKYTYIPFAWNNDILFLEAKVIGSSTENEGIWSYNIVTDEFSKLSLSPNYLTTPIISPNGKYFIYGGTQDITRNLDSPMNIIYIYDISENVEVTVESDINTWYSILGWYEDSLETNDLISIYYEEESMRLKSANQVPFKLPWVSGISYCVSTGTYPSPPGSIGSSTICTNQNPHTYIAIDFDTPNDRDDPVLAVADGVIDFAGWQSTTNHSFGFGLYVRIKHSDETYTYYGHLKSISVNVGDIVQQGCRIGIEGTTGESSGDHIHFERRDANYAKYTNSWPVFGECGCTPHQNYLYTSSNEEVSCGVTPPDNNDCLDAESITSNGSCKTGTVEGATTSYGPNSCDGCGGCDKSKDDNDVYYKFVAKATNHTVTVNTESNDFDAVIELRTDCGYNTSIGCWDPSNKPTTVSHTWDNLTIGKTYYIRVYEYNNSATPPSSPEFEICVTHETITQKPDLIVVSENVQPTTVAPGQPFTVSCKVKNNGTGNSVSSYTAVWLSKDQNFDGEPTDYNLNADMPVPALNSGATSNTLSEQVVLPGPMSPGPWYIMFGADALDDNNESDEDNNIFFPITIGTTCTTPGIPATATGTVTGATTADLSWSAGNPAGSSTVTYYWVVGTSSTVTYGNGVAQNTTTGNTATVTGLTPGTKYYLRVYARTSCNNTESGYKTSSSFTTDEVCIAPISPTSATASQTTITSGQSTTLQVNGGALNSASNWIWYTGNCGGSQVGTGTTLSVSPTTTTTYYVQASACGSTTTCRSVTITVNPNCVAPTSPTSATASQTTITSGQSTTLQVNGGALNSASNWVWYTGSCGGSQVGTGTTLSVSPTSTTTYYVQAAACGSTTTCRSVTITVNPNCVAPTSPTSATASQTTITSGQSTTLQVNGGALNSAPNWVWYTGNCGGSQVGTGTTLSVSPTTTTTYYVQASACGSTTTCRSVTITVTQECVAPSAPASFTFSIGDPANGLEHHLDASVSEVLGVDGYSWEFSIDGIDWSDFYENNSTFLIWNFGDSPNQPFYWRIRAYNCIDKLYSSYTYATPQPIYTACDDPVKPTVNGITSNSLNITLNAEIPVENPAYTNYSIYCITTGKYVQSNGTLGNTEVFKTKVEWGTKTITGLSQDTQYCFYAKAKNNDGDIRFNTSNSACGTTSDNCTPPVSPTSATASQTTITSGESTTLQINGGALNSASNWVWYTGSCGGSQVGTGTTLSVSPTSTATYYVQASACGSTTTCRSVTITVNPNCVAPTSPTSATASQTTITSGQSTTLQVNGGALNSASNWVWYTGSCGGSQVGTGTTLSVSPTTTTTYYVQASACGSTTTCRSVTITVLPSSGCNPPTSQSGIIFSDVVANAITINTTGGNGNRRIIMINTVNSFTIPEIGTEPSANSIYSGSGEQVVYFGAANNVTVTGLRSGVRYWVRVFEANCKGESTVYNANTLEDNPSSISTICNSPVSPLKAEANPVNIFSGETTTLQVIGGSLNAAPDWEWYSGSCNGVLVGKGASISVSPATTTTYFVHASACGVNTICREVTVTVNDENSVIDADGNVYSIVTIGNQTWLGQNLKTTKYNDGTSIPLVTNNNTWSNLSGPAYCWYNNDISYKNPFGALYNWYAVNSGKLCPKGWHVPSDEEWTALINYLGGAYIAGGKLKEVGLQYWISPNQDAINSTGFSGLPGGFRSSFDGKFSNFSSSGDWWSSTQENSIYAWGRSIWNSSGQIYRYSDVDKKSGASVRCICDSPVGNKDLSVNDFIKIYPNPASKEIFIESSNYSGQNCTVEIWSMDGKKVITRGNMDLTHKQTLKTSELTSGFYFLRIYSDEINFNQKIVIKQE